MLSYTLEQCDERIAHWDKELGRLSTANYKPDKLLELTNTYSSLLSFWKGYKRKNYNL